MAGGFSRVLKIFPDQDAYQKIHARPGVFQIPARQIADLVQAVKQGIAMSENILCRFRDVSIAHEIGSDSWKKQGVVLSVILQQRIKHITITFTQDIVIFDMDQQIVNAKILIVNSGGSTNFLGNTQCG